jgi:N-acetylglucosaminyl-diphospho-decaprenol L-rhamnosyltransferase
MALLLRSKNSYFVFITCSFLTLSIIIVNYNVKFFLEQCLCSVIKAIAGIEAEVLVIDNDSADGSVGYLRPKFSFVRFIENKENLGFAKANNIGLALAKGKYVLFLNPDTIVAEDSFQKSIDFILSNQDAGALGVKMVDGSGKYLKESKRGFPSPWASFCKLAGLTFLFPRSGIFANYYLGDLTEQRNQMIDVISGAFFFVKQETLDQTGGFDERFFMYAEDIDLSYRIQQAGFKNYYLSETTIIHFKGESTKKDRRYVKLFYRAMSQFARKQFRGSSTHLFSVMIEVAIWFRSVISIIGNFLQKRSTTKNTASRFLLTGDGQTTRSLLKLVSPMHLHIVNAAADADELIFCEGHDYSFKKIISEFQDPVNRLRNNVHASNSLSVVGSHSKNSSGEIIVL